MVKDKEIQLSLEKIYSVSEEKFNNVFTPFETTKQMVDALGFNCIGNLLILVNLEFIIELRKRHIDLSNVYYSTGCKYKKQFAIKQGIDPNNVFDLTYNNKEINVIPDNMAMKFDYMVGNPPYNPNSIWKKFVQLGIDSLNENGKMVFIHPDSWRKKSSHKKLFNHLKKHISKLYLTGFNSFDANISTDWYVYHKNVQKEITINYENGDIETVDNDLKHIFSFSNKSIPASIIKKITSKKDNGLINLSANSFDDEYTVYEPNGKYKQCGGIDRGTAWTKGDFHLKNDPTKYQFDNKIVMSYTRKLRATHFTSNDEVGVVCGYLHLIDNLKSSPLSICLLYNSKLLYNIMCAIESEKNLNHHPVWLLKSLNIDNCYFETEEEMYQHFGLTEEEINWVNE